MVIYKKGKYDVTYDRLINYHWFLLNPRKKDGTYRTKQSLIGRFETSCSIFIKKGELNKAKVLRFFINNDYRNLKELTITPTQRLNRLNKKIIRLLKKNRLYKNMEFYNEMLNEIFNYRIWRRNGKFEKLFNLMGIPVCPYCNSNEIYNYTDQKRNIVVTSVDHFYDKATYPYFSLTFSNLIPVCKDCNEIFKGTNSFMPFTHLHPYFDDYNDYCTFTNTILLGKQGPIEITYKNQRERSQSTNRDLGIKERYNTLNSLDEAKRIHYLQQDYPESKKEELIATWQLFSKEDVERRICDIQLIPFERDNIRLKQRGKLKRDLAIKYGILTVRK